MNKKKALQWLLPALVLVLAIIQFIPSAPVIAPVNLPPEQRATHRLLQFEGIANFRDLGGYKTTDNHSVKWGTLYRSGSFDKASRSDLRALANLKLSTLVDFRSSIEKEDEPSVLPEPAVFRVVEIPTLDDGNKAMVGEIMERIESGNFEGFDPDAAMLDANRQFASTFTPQFREFIQLVLNEGGKPVAWHCSAGKDRTGFAAAILLRILGVPQITVMADYMQSKRYALAGRKNDLRLLRLFKGDEAADKLTIMMGVEESWLTAAFDEIDRQWSDFDRYVSDGLQLSPADVEQLRSTLLE
ncbi:MAG: tyrosine-protein phosphatase [Proteobacteria bacterium]|nr:tyrosine-protein phosphatase [Pseudomonadota bacterium]